MLDAVICPSEIIYPLLSTVKSIPFMFTITGNSLSCTSISFPNSIFNLSTVNSFPSDFAPAIANFTFSSAALYSVVVLASFALLNIPFPPAIIDIETPAKINKIIIVIINDTSVIPFSSLLIIFFHSHLFL